MAEIVDRRGGASTSTSTSASAPATARSRIRRRLKENSEQRKEQNRIASRNYREKRRQKLALLEQILDTANTTTTTINTAAAAVTPSVAPAAGPATSAAAAGRRSQVVRANEDVAAAAAAALPPDLSSGLVAPDATPETAAAAFELASFPPSLNYAGQGFGDLLLQDGWPSQLDLLPEFDEGFCGGGDDDNAPSLSAPTRTSTAAASSTSSVVSGMLLSSPSAFADSSSPASASSAAAGRVPAASAPLGGLTLIPHDTAAGALFTRPEGRDGASASASASTASPAPVPAEEARGDGHDAHSSSPAPMLRAVVRCFGTLTPRQKYEALAAIQRVVAAEARSTGESGLPHPSGRVVETEPEEDAELHTSSSTSARPPRRNYVPAPTGSDDAGSWLTAAAAYQPMPAAAASSTSSPRSFARLSTIRVQQSSFFAAILQNALACGLAPPDRLLSDGSDCSPFSQEGGAVMARSHGGSGGEAGLARARARFASVTKDLRPADNQILLAHHPYLDVIPFRTFRERAVAAVACSPPLFDEEELCCDFQRDGLICWGSSSSASLLSTSSSSRRSGDPRDMGACVPWDMRSWEPQVWFLKKYWFLVGGWDDEMWSNARWWHALRGERLEASV